MGEFKNVKETTTIDRKLEGQVATSQALSHEFGLSDAKVAALMHTSKRTAFNHRKALANVRAWEDRTPENKKAAIDRAKRLIAQKSVAEATALSESKFVKYTLNFRPNGQDQLNISSFRGADKIPSFLDYDDVLKYSLERGEIGDESEIKTLVDGSNRIKAYFSSNDPAYEAENIVDNAGVKFKKNKYEYDLF